MHSSLASCVGGSTTPCDPPPSAPSSSRLDSIPRTCHLHPPHRSTSTLHSRNGLPTSQLCAHSFAYLYCFHCTICPPCPRRASQLPHPFPASFPPFTRSSHSTPLPHALRPSTFLFPVWVHSSVYCLFSIVFLTSRLVPLAPFSPSA